MKKRHFMIVLTVLIVASIGMAFILRGTTEQQFDFNNHTLLDEAVVRFVKEQELLEFGNLPEGSQSLIQDTPVIVIVKPTGGRRLKDGTVFTETHVEKAIKGAEYLLASTIYVYEPVQLQYVEGTYYYMTTSYCLMESGKQYLLFLKPLPYPEGYILDDEQKSSFLLTDQLLAQYPIESPVDNPILIELDNAGDTQWKDVKNNTILTESATVSDLYLKFRKEVFDRLFP